MKRPIHLLFLGTIVLVTIGFGVLKNDTFLTQLKQQLAFYQQELPEEKVYLHLDRPFYTVGENIWLKAYLLNGTTHQISQLSDVIHVDLLSPKGTIVKKLRLKVDTGLGDGNIFLPTNFPGGTYTLVAYTRWMKNSGKELFFRKTIQVQKVIAPRLLMTLDFQKKAYGAGSEVNADVSIRDLEDEAIPDLTFTASVFIAGKRYINKEFKTNKEGKAVVNFRLPNNLTSNDGLVALKFQYDGETESISRSIPITLNNIELQFFPEGGDLVIGVSSKVAFKALNEFGKAADVAGIIVDDQGAEIQKFESYHLGMGAFTMKAEKGRSYFAMLKEPVASTKQYPLPQALSTGITLSLTAATEQELKISGYAPETAKVNLVAQVRGKIYYTAELTAQAGINEWTIPTEKFPTGIAQITLFDAKGLPKATRLCFVNQHRKLKVDISLDQEVYQPRQKVLLNIKTTDHTGAPVPTNLSLAVADDKIISLADDKQDNILSWMLMSSDLKGKVEEPHFYFKEGEPKAKQALDFVMMTHGWRRFTWKEIQEDNAVAYYPAEISGAIIGQLINRNTGKPMKGTVYLLEVGDEGRMEEVETDEEGNFAFLNIDRSRSLELFAHVRHKSKKAVYIRLTQNLTTKGRITLDGKKVKPKISTEKLEEVEAELLEEATAEESSRVSLSMNANGATLEDIVITAYGVEHKKGTLGAVTTIIEDGDIGRLLRGRAAGVDIQAAPSVRQNQGNIIMRGYRSIGGNNHPLFVVDGVQYLQENGATILDRLIVGDIEKITVLKGLSSTMLYGARGANGVVLITTKNHNTRPEVGLKEYKSRYAHLSLAPMVFALKQEFYVPNYTAHQLPEKRIDFRNTIFWAPNIQTDKNGEAALSFYNSDATTVFRITAEGIGLNGKIARAEKTYYTQLPFSIDAKIPPYLTFGDQIQLPVTLRNTSQKVISGMLSAEASRHLSTIRSQQVSIAAGETKTLYLPTTVQAIEGEGKIVFSFNSPSIKDVIEREIEVEGKGYVIGVSLSGNVPKTVENITISDPVTGTLKAEFVTYQNVLGQLMDGLSSIFRSPYGCFEQTSSSTYPNILALHYLNTSGKAQPEIKQKALSYIDKGYKRLIGFECKGGGYDWFGRGPANLWLTAYGVMEFKDMRAVYPKVDKQMLSRTENWLFTQMNKSGRFVQKEGNRYAANTHFEKVLHAYVLYALSTTRDSRLNKGFKMAYQEAISIKDAYLMGLVANTAFELKKEEEGNILLAAIMKQWEDYGYFWAKRSITYGRGVGLQVEAAALALMASLKVEKPNVSHITKLAKFIAQHRRGGGFGNTQTTVLALKALVAYEAYSKVNETSGTVALWVNDKVVMTERFGGANPQNIEVNQLEKFLSTGEQEVRVEFDSKQKTLAHSFDIRYKSHTPPSNKECEITLATSVATNQTSIGETLRFTTTLKSKSDEQSGMVLAKIGIPSGLSPQAWQLKELQEKELIDYYEIHKNYVVFYFTSFKPLEEKELYLDLKAEVPGTYRAPASSAYLYYTSEFKYWERGVEVTVGK